MLERAIATRSSMDIASRLGQRLTQTLGGEFRLREETCGEYRFCNVAVMGNEEAALERLSQALTLVIERDYLSMEITRYIRKNGAALSSAQAHHVLLDTMRHVRAHESAERVAKCIRDLLTSEKELVIEGLLRFRMPDLHASWLESAECALQNSLLRAELSRFSEMLCALERPKVEALVVHVVFQPGGALVLMDEAHQHVRDEAYRLVSDALQGEALLIGLLIAMAPEHIVVYNASEARSAAEEIGRVFGDRVEFIS